MKKTLVVAIALVLNFLAPAASADPLFVSRDVHLSTRDHVPLYNCDIIADMSDRHDCRVLQNGRHQWENGGYAVNCREFNRHHYDRCRTLAHRLVYDRYAFDCRRERSHLERDRCEVVSRAYAEGFFPRTRMSRPEVIIHRDPPPVVIVETNRCDGSYYDRAYQNWLNEKEEQRRRGQTRTAVGVGAVIIGAILGGSDSSTTRAIGQGLVIGGAFMTTWGLVELADSNSSYAPHMMPACRNAFRAERKRVIVEQRHCESTRYTEHGWGSSRTYYEVRCENRSYVTYERFSPWEESRTYIR